MSAEILGYLGGIVFTALLSLYNILATIIALP